MLYHVWEQPVKSTLQLLETLTNNTVCAFNLSFDWFHVNKLYNLFYWVKDANKPPSIKEIAAISTAFNGARQAIPKHWILKPKGALDLFLVSRKSEWQSLMDRRTITIKRVPVDLASKMATFLNRYIVLPKIYGAYWSVKENEDDEDGHMFPYVQCKFSASGGLKPLCKEIFKVEVQDFPIPKEFWPAEDSYNPYNLGWYLNENRTGQPFKDPIITKHISYWRNDRRATTYATDDITFLDRLYTYFGCPEENDDDSALAAAVGAIRWHGYSIDDRAIRKRMGEINELLTQGICTEREVNPASPKQVLAWLREGLNTAQKLAIPSTNEKVLDKIIAKGDTNAATESNTVWAGVSRKCKRLIEFRHSSKEQDLLNKLLTVGRFNPDFKVIGTKSGRMSGGGVEKSGQSLNPQGVQRDSRIRSYFTFNDSPDFTVSGGDFAAFEVTINHGACRDSALGQALASGKSFHGIFGAALYEISYDELMAKKNGDPAHYHASKTSSLAYQYGAMADKIAESSGRSVEQVESTLAEIGKQFPQMRATREAIHDAFCSMRQPDGIGTKIIWSEPRGHIESLLGFRRYFTLENTICKRIFELAQKLPPELQGNKRVRRRDREQSSGGALQSALYQACFNLQSQNMRSASNHVIQSTGGQICKGVQRAVWDLQPDGISEPVALPMNLHDEIVVLHRKEIERNGELVDGAYLVKRTVYAAVEAYREVVPLLDIDWKENVSNWAEIK